MLLGFETFDIFNTDFQKTFHYFRTESIWFDSKQEEKPVGWNANANSVEFRL
jgi:hypothetical protein